MTGLPPGIDLAADDQNQIIGSVSATWALATIALAMRFLCRRISKAGYWWDDWLMVPAYLFTSISSWISMTWMINYGLGKHIYVQPPARIPECVVVFLKALFTTEVCYTGTIVFAKFSILAFYWRLFSRNNFVRWAVIVITVIVSMWGIAVFLIVVTQCRPIQGFWDKTLTTAVCSVDSYKFFYGNSTPNIITDILLILTPLPAIWALRLELRQKISLSGIFLLGVFVTAVSITRLVVLVNLDITSQDVTWVFRMPQIWTCVELNIAVVCGCLPQLRPLLLLITTGSATGSTTSGSAVRKTSPTATAGSTKRSFFSKSGASAMDTEIETNVVPASPEPQEKNFGDTRPLVGVQGKKGGAGYIELGNMEAGHGNQHRASKSAVWVQTEWDVTTSSKSQASSERSSKDHARHKQGSAI